MSQSVTPDITLVCVFGAMTASIMTMRLALRKYRGQSFNLSDYITMASICCVLCRTANEVVVLDWGSNNLAIPSGTILTPEQISHRRIGSILSLATRFLYNLYLWMQKSIVLLMCRHIVRGLPFPEQIIKMYWFLLFATWITVEVTCFTDCSPVHLYWQVVPNPGSCVHSRTELITLVAMNIMTDALLILLPMPWLLRVKRSPWERIQLIGLFSTGIFLIVIALIRLPKNAGADSLLVRDTWASVELFLSAFVANIPTLVSLSRMGRKVTSSGVLSNTSHYFRNSRSRGRSTGRLESESRSQLYSTLVESENHEGSSSNIHCTVSGGGGGTTSSGITVTESIDLSFTKVDTGHLLGPDKPDPVYRGPL